MLTKSQQSKLAKRFTAHRIRVHKLGNHLMTLNLNRKELQTLLASIDAAEIALSNAVTNIDLLPVIRSDPPR